MGCAVCLFMFLLRVSNSSLYFVKHVPITFCFEFPEKSLQFPFLLPSVTTTTIITKLAPTVHPGILLAGIENRGH